jgi:hypothetical protein
MNRALGVVVAVCLLAGGAMGQDMGRLIAEPWNGNVCYQSYDHPIIEAGGHVNGDSSDSQVFGWDSFGRIRFNPDDQQSPFVAYHLLTLGLGTDTPLFKTQMDQMDGVMGLHLSGIAGWDIGVTVGGGYSSTHPFVNENGVYQIGHLTAQKPIDANDSFLLAVDYEGDSSLLPDVPLPGFAFQHRGEVCTFMVGYPLSYFAWMPEWNVKIAALYEAPYTADIDLDYRMNKHYGFYGDVGNFFQGFVRSDSDIDHRQFFQMTRMELGLRCNFDPYWDAAMGIGYAFDQNVSNGYDIRDMHGVGHISNEPYLAFIFRGGF